MPPKKNTNIEKVKAAAAGRWPEILSSVGGLDSDLLDGKHWPCPKCGGTDRFRLLDRDTGALFCNVCFDKKCGDGIAAIGWLLGENIKAATARIGEYLGVKLRGAKSKKDNPPKIFATTAGLVRYCRNSLAKQHGSGVMFIRSWNYRTFHVLRFDLPTPGGEKPRKEFRPVHRVPLGTEGRHGWQVGYPAGLRPLYHLSEIENTPTDQTLTVHGGEKAVDAAVALGLPATTNAGGEKAVAQTDWSPVARFARVVVSIDNDVAGHAYGAEVSAQLKRIKPDLDVKILMLPDLPSKGDIVEWIEAGGTKEQFDALAAEAAAPDPIAHDRAICSALKIDVLGQTKEKTIKIFSEERGTSIEIGQISRLTFPEMLQHFGPIVREKVYEAAPGMGGQAPPGMTEVRRVREAIAVVGGSETAGEGVELGMGCWQGEDNQVVLVGPGAAAVWDGKKLIEHRQPRVAGLKVDLDHAKEFAWFDFRKLSGYLEQAGDYQWVASTVDRATKIFENWYWRSAVDVSAELITGLVMATFVQSFWSWRPLVSIAGASDSGKTTLFETLEAIFGKLALLNSKSTEAGIRQAIANHSKAVMCDEFESDRHRKQILEYFRTSSKGSKTLRGTSHNKGAREYGLKHIPWVAAIEVGLTRAPDRNRFIMFELLPPPSEKRGRLTLPSVVELNDLGQRLLAVSVRLGGRACRLAELLRGMAFEGIHGRVVESFSIPAAILAAVCDADDETAQGMMRAIFAEFETDPAQATKDETELLGTIFDSHVDLGRGEKATVGQILQSSDSYPGGLESLERIGIAKVCDRSGPRSDSGWSSPTHLFFAHKSILRFILKGTQWEHQSIEQILRRMPDATSSQRRIAGHRPWGVSIPLATIEKFLGESDGQNGGF